MEFPSSDIWNPFETRLCATQLCLMLDCRPGKDKKEIAAQRASCLSDPPFLSQRGCYGRKSLKQD